MGVTILAGTTLSTSVVGMSKVMSQLGTTKTPEVPEIHQTIQQPESKTQVTQTDNNSLSTSRSSTPQSIVVTQPSPTHPVAKSSIITTSTKTPTTSNISTIGKCIITLSGSQYDVTPLQTSHSGGNIFTCGTDMTSVYIAQHGNNFSRMQGYLITSSSPSQSNGSTSTASGNSSSGSSSSLSGREIEDKDEDSSVRESETDKKEEEKQRESEKHALEQQNESEDDN